MAKSGAAFRCRAAASMRICGSSGLSWWPAVAAPAAAACCPYMRLVARLAAAEVALC